MTTALSQQIQQFYDSSSGLWEKIWGEHMHHGYYGQDGQQRKDRRQAQIDLIEELLTWSQIQSAHRILDVGCGIGGSALYLSEKYDADVVGITLSPVQAARARERAHEMELAHRTSFNVENALQTSFADESFDFIWSMESGEHMPDKTQFLKECYRLLKPGGTFLMATWCHRSTHHTPLTPSEQQHLADIYRVYYLPYVISLPQYEEVAQQIGFQAVRSDDWSTAVAPFWNIVIGSALTPTAVLGLLTSGWTTIRGALSLNLMSRGYQRGLIKYGIMCGSKS